MEKVKRSFMTGCAIKCYLHQFFLSVWMGKGVLLSFLSVIKNQFFITGIRKIEDFSLLRAKRIQKMGLLALFLCEKQELLCTNF